MADEPKPTDASGAEPAKQPLAEPIVQNPGAAPVAVTPIKPSVTPNAPVQAVSATPATPNTPAPASPAPTSSMPAPAPAPKPVSAASSEVTAADLLSLWGSGAKTSTPKPAVQPQATMQTPPQAPAASVTSIPVAAPAVSVAPVPAQVSVGQPSQTAQSALPISSKPKPQTFVTPPPPVSLVQATPATPRPTVISSAPAPAPEAPPPIQAAHAYASVQPPPAPAPTPTSAAPPTPIALRPIPQATASTPTPQPSQMPSYSQPKPSAASMSPAASFYQPRTTVPSTMGAPAPRPASPPTPAPAQSIPRHAPVPGTLPQPAPTRLTPPPREDPPVSGDLPWQTSKTPPSVRTTPTPQASPPPPAAPRPTVTPTVTPPPTPKPEPKPEVKVAPIIAVAPPSFDAPKKETKKIEVVEGDLVSEEITSKKKPKVPEPPELIEDQIPESSESSLDEFLAELHLSKRHIFYGLGCFFLLIVLVWGGILSFRYISANGFPGFSKITSLFSSKPSQIPPPSSNVPPPSTPAETPIISTKDQTGISSGSLVGQNNFITSRQIQTSGIDATVAIGKEAEDSIGISYYVDTFRRLQNAYATDVHELLNKSTDRRTRLSSYVILLKNLSAEGKKIQIEIPVRMTLIQNQFTNAQNDQTILDKQFFDKLAAFDGSGSETTLTYFIQTSKIMVSLRAEYRALQKVVSLYDQGIPKVDQRIRDLELNEEALVSGIKVYDVSGSDLQLIVPIGAPDSSSSDSLSTGFSSPSFQVLPNPAEIKTEHDYITNPGGGFAPASKHAPNVVPVTH